MHFPIRSCVEQSAEPLVLHAERLQSHGLELCSQLPTSIQTGACMGAAGLQQLVILSTGDSNFLVSIGQSVRPETRYSNQQG